MDVAAPHQSLFVVMSYGGNAPYCISVLQLETPVNNQSAAAHLIPVQVKRLHVNQQDYVARFRVPPKCPSIKWLLSPPTISTQDLYMVPDWDIYYPNHNPYYIHKKPPSRGYKFNFRTGECRPIRPPRATKFLGQVNWSGGHIYLMAHPDYYYDTPDPVFESYDPDQNKWKALEPFPDHAVNLLGCSIEATAVLDDTILYNMGSCRIWAYYVPKNKWYIVHVEDDRCYDIVGEAVVLGNTIYALTDPFRSRDLVLALSIEREQRYGDPVFKCSLRSEILVPGMDQIKYKVRAHKKTRHLLHLGKDNFCLVQSCNLLNDLGLYRYQPIQLTSIKHVGKNLMTVTNICVYEVQIQCDEQFEVRRCFSLPEFKTSALNEGKRFVYNLDPCQEGYAAYASQQDDKTDYNPEPEVEQVQASTHGDCAEEGHSIYVRNLPPDATVGDLEKESKKFGSIKSDGIRVKPDYTENGRFAACVEFDSASSKQDAIEASSIIIKGCRAEIEERRIFGFFVGRILCRISERDYTKSSGS